MTLRLKSSAARAALIRASFVLTVAVVAAIGLIWHIRSGENLVAAAKQEVVRPESRQAIVLTACDSEASLPPTAIRLVASEEEQTANRNNAVQPLWMEEGRYAATRKREVSAPSSLVTQGQAATPPGIAIPVSIETVDPQPSGPRAHAVTFPAAPAPLASNGTDVIVTPRTVDGNVLKVRYSDPEAVAPAEGARRPAAEIERGQGLAVDNPLCPQQPEIGFGRIDAPCGCDSEDCMTTCEKVEAFHAANHPRFYFERPFGSYVISAVNAQISNGIADQMVLYHYDFQQGARASELTIRGRYQLSKFAHRMLSCGFSIVIEETPADPALADARRNAVMAELQKMDDSIGRLDDLVLVARPRLPGLRGAEAQLIDDNNLLQTQSRGTIGPGAAVDYGSDNGGQSSVPTIP